MAKLRALYILAEGALSLIYGPNEQRDIVAWADIYAPPQTRETIAQNPDLLRDAEAIFSGWGAPVLDTAFLNAAPDLKAFFYGAGATSGLIGPEAWERGIVVTSASRANAVPVAEFTLASIIFALKRALPMMRQGRKAGKHVQSRPTVAGTYGATVGLVSLGEIGRLVATRMAAVLPDVVVLAYDPFLAPELAAQYGVELVEMDALFRRSDVVSLHTPWLPETERLIRGHHISAMKSGATLINTARGAIIAEEEMIAVLTERADLTAVLDVTHPEPPQRESALWRLENVFLTPHIAGSLDTECRRMGRFMADELRRYCQGEPLLGAVRPETAHYTAHRPRA
ncbi:MAG: glycerate dehydrogenase [Chthonomonadaceae bacterium]|nr:glycerate dehydrogenase [Chthonomonadaceae bacterium]